MKTSTSLEAHCYVDLVLQNISEIIVTTDLQFRVQSWNRAAEEFYRIPASEALGKQMKDLVSFTFHGTSYKAALTKLQQKKCWRGKVSFTNCLGETHYFLQMVKYIHDNDGTE